MAYLLAMVAIAALDQAVFGEYAPMTDRVMKVGGLSVYGVRGVIVTFAEAAAMKTETHLIDRAQDSCVSLRKDTIARIKHADGARFVGDAYLTAEENTLVVAYADGTTVSVAL